MNHGKCIKLCMMEIGTTTWNFYLADKCHPKLRRHEISRIMKKEVSEEDIENEIYEDYAFLSMLGEVYISNAISIERAKHYAASVLYNVFLYSYGITFADMNEESECDLYGAHIEDMMTKLRLIEKSITNGYKMKKA